MNVLIIIGHPRKESLCQSLAYAYGNGAQKNAHTVKYIELSNKNINRYGDIAEKETDEDNNTATQWRSDVLWADHMVFIFPTRRYTAPACLKGWFDITFIPKFSHQYTGYLKRKKLLKGRTASLITTCGGPKYTFRPTLGHPGFKRLKRTLWFVGIKHKKSKIISRLAPGIRSKENISKIIKKIGKLGENTR